NDDFPLYCDGVLIKSHMAALTQVVPTLEDDGHWTADIVNIGPRLGWAPGRNWELDVDKVKALRPQPEPTTIADNKPRKPGTKYKDDWPLLMAAEIVRLALRDPEMLKNVDALVRYMIGPDPEGFLQKELGWAPKDSKDVRKMIVSLLQFVR